MGISQAELAQRIGETKEAINEIINAEVAITPKIALQLEKELGPSADFWNNRERIYQKNLARIQEKDELAAGQVGPMGCAKQGPKNVQTTKN